MRERFGLPLDRRDLAIFLCEDMGLAGTLARPEICTMQKLTTDN
jgi:hypothetical protein